MTEPTASPYLDPDGLPQATILSKIYDAMSDGVVGFDIHGRIVFCNPAMGMLCAQPVEDLIGRSAHEAWGGGNVDRTGDQSTTAVEEMIVRPDGTRRLVVGRSFSITSEPPISVTIFRDVTRTRRTSQALRTQNLWLQEFMNNCPGVCYAKDEKGRYVFVNPVLEAFLEKPQSMILGKTDTDLFPPHVARKLRENDAEVMLRSEALRFVESFPRTNGISHFLSYKFPIRDQENRPMVAGIALDVTEQRRSQEALEIRDSLLRTIITHAPITVFALDANGIITLAEGNNFVLGVRPLVELQGENLLEFLPGNTRIREKFEAAFRGATVEFEWETEDGRLHDMSCVPLMNHSGLVYSIVCLATDVTKRRREEEERKLRNEEQQRAQKLEALGVLAGGIAHDFNNILLGIMGNAGLALLDAESDTPQHGRLQQIELAAQRAADLTNQMLAYAGRGRLVVEAIDLSAVVREMIALLNAAISKRARMNIHLEEGLPCIEGDISQIRQVVMNLIINASEALEEGDGEITVRTGLKNLTVPPPGEARFSSTLTPGRYVYLEVRDTGKGIDEQTQLKIFEPFYTTKSTGRGLGLSAVQGIVRGHRGTIRLDSVPQSGTTFTIYFPARESQTSVPRQEGARGTKSWTGSGRIYVVDDEEMVRKVAQAIFERVGFEVRTAVDGLDALEQLSRSDANPTAVLLDMNMPRVGGSETLRELRRVYPDLPVILSSGFNEEEAMHRSRDNHKVGFIQKPYSAHQLIDKIREMLEGEG